MWKPNGAHTSRSTLCFWAYAQNPVSRLVSADGSLLFMSCLPPVVNNERKARDRADAGKSTKYDINCRKSDSHLCSPPFTSPGGL